MTQAAAPHDWSQYGLSDMWRMLYPQSRANGQIAVLMWRQVHELCRTEADRIDAALAKLREAWPTTQAAAAAFQTWAGRWVEAMRTTAENASKNGPIVDTITAEIETARGKIAELIDEAGEYEAMDPLSAETRYYIRHASDGEWALTGWREGLNRQGREVMAYLEQQIATYASGFAVERPFHPELADPIETASTPPLWPIAWRGTGSGSVSLPELPDRVGLYPGSSDSSASIPGGLANDVGGIDGAGGDTSSGGTLLSGVVRPGLDPMTGLPLGGSLGGVGAGGSFVDTPSGRVLAPGGLLGPAPGIDRSGGMGAATRGGVTPMIPPIVGGQPAATPGSTKSGKRRSRKRTVPGIFEVGHGLPEVIEPAQDPNEHDPGPNVFGIDR